MSKIEMYVYIIIVIIGNQIQMVFKTAQVSNTSLHFSFYINL